MQRGVFLNVVVSITRQKLCLLAIVFVVVLIFTSSATTANYTSLADLLEADYTYEPSSFTSYSIADGSKELKLDFIKRLAFDVADDIETYLQKHPNKTVHDLQTDEEFRALALLPVGETGYTFLHDCENLVNVLHINPVYEGINYYDLKDEPGREAWWQLKQDSLGCHADSSGFYLWLDTDGVLREKYLYGRVIQTPTADGVYLVISASTYLDELNDLFEIPESVIVSDDKSNIDYLKDVSDDISQKIVFYMQSHPQKTLADLKDDAIFTSISSHTTIGDGYTALYVLEDGEIISHPVKEFNGISLSLIMPPESIFWDWDASLRQGVRSLGGYYDWIEPTGEVRQKYMEIRAIPVKTADSQTLVLATTMYVDSDSSSTSFLPQTYVLIFVILFVVTIGFLLLFSSQVDFFGKKITLKFIKYFLLIAVLPLIIFSIFFFYSQTQTSHFITQQFDTVQQQTLTQINTDLVDLTTNIVEKIDRLSYEFSLFSSGLPLEELLLQANATASLHGDNFYPSPLTPQWHEVQQRFKDICLVDDGNCEMLRVFHKNGYIVNGLVQGQEDSSDYKGDKSWFADTLQLKSFEDIHISPISIARRINVSNIRYSQPIFSGNSVLGLFVANFKSSVITERIESYEYGTRGFATLVDYSYETAEGDILNWPVIISRSIDESDSFVLTEDKAYAFSISKDELGTQLQGSFSKKMWGEDYVVFYRQVSIPQKEWYVFIVIPQEELFALSTQSEQSLRDNQSVSLLYFLFILLLTILLSGFVAFIYSSKLSKPINDLAIVSQKIQEGDFSQRVSITTHDELEDLGIAFNKTIDVLSKTQEERKQIDAMKTEFMSITSHELRSPMTPMQAQLEMLREGYFGKLTKKQKNSLRIILRNTQRLDKIISDFLEVSRIEAARLKFDFQNISLQKAIEDVIDEMNAFLPEKNISLTLDMPSSLPVFEVDPNRTMQVLRNLLNNAIKFTPENGLIKVVVQVRKQDLLFSVTDSGVGIKEEDLNKIFQPFAQVDNMYQHKSGGTGLGLAICRGIVVSQNGSIWVESEGLGTGSTFNFTVPFTPVKEVKPIKLLFSSDEKIKTDLLEIFKKYLGPIADKEFDLLKKSSIKESLLNEYFLFLKEYAILSDDSLKEFERDVLAVMHPSQNKKLDSSLLKNSPLLKKNSSSKRVDHKNVSKKGSAKKTVVKKTSTSKHKKTVSKKKTSSTKKTSSKKSVSKKTSSSTKKTSSKKRSSKKK